MKRIIRNFLVALSIGAMALTATACGDKKSGTSENKKLTLVLDWTLGWNGKGIL